MTIHRRDFITLLGGAAAAWPLAGLAQQSAMPVIGYLDSTAAAASVSRVAAFRQGLAEAGFVEGRNLAPIEFRWAENQADRLPALAAEVVPRRVAVIVTNGNSTGAAKAATTTIPIVFISGGDPILSGLVTSLSRPSGNVTGVSFFTAPLNPKRFELLDELVPKSAVIGVLVDPSNRTADPDAEAVRAGARALGRQILVIKASAESEFDGAFSTMVQAGVGGLFVIASPFFFLHRLQLVALAARHALPASYGDRAFSAVGGLMSYSASDTDAYRRGATYVGRILKGAQPSDLPVELPAKYEFILNLATAKALKLEIPAKLLALADEVIE
jgi:putative ABC transport system substrate-binding protein